MFRLQAAQNSIYRYEKLYRDTTTYHRTVAVELSGELDIDLLKKAIQNAMQRHEILRSRIDEQEDGTYLKIIPDSMLTETNSWPMKTIDATHITAAPVEDLYDTLKKLGENKFIEEPFRFKDEPLWRCILVKTTENKFQFCMLFHHIIVDENSIGIILRDITTYYNALANSQTPEFSSVPALENVHIGLEEDEKEKRLTYWKNTLANLNSVNLQTDSPHEKSFRFNGKRIPFHLENTLIKSLEEKFPGYSLNTIILASLYSLINRYSNETDICIGITSANRRHDNTISRDTMENHLTNCFFNTLPLRQQFDRNTTFAQLLPLVKKTTVEALKNQLPLDEVFQMALSSDIKATLKTASPFNILLVLNQEKPTLELKNMTATYPVELDLGHCKFPYFGINLDKLKDGSYQAFVEYNTDLFKQKTIERLIGHLEMILHTVITNPEQTISNIPLLLPEEKELIDSLNHNDESTINDLSVPDYFHQLAQKIPSQPMAVFHNENKKIDTFSYTEMDVSTNKLANYINHAYPDTGEKTIGICLTRSNQLITTSLAALKAGRVMVPIETNASKSLYHKINTTNTPLVIVDNQTRNLFSQYPVKIINIENISTIDAINKCSPDYLPTNIKPSDPAYIMFTSGSTGKPKTVLLTHGGFSNLLYELKNQHLRSGSKILSTALPTFDAFYYDLLVALATNGELHLTFDKGRYSPEILNDVIEKSNITYGVFLPDTLGKLDPSSSLEHIISMGAAPHEDTLKLWTNKPGRVVENGLGHTETGICLSLHQFTPGEDPSLIGKPIRNMKMFVLNPETLTQCPIGVPGEIFVAGPGVADSYIGSPELTKQKFPHLSFNSEMQSFEKCDPEEKEHNEKAIKVYASGDYGCLQLTNNNSLEIKFLGRRDRQLKINGVRVELDAIEELLRSHPLIKDVAILPQKGNTSLIAYIVPTSAETTEEELRKQIRQHLVKTLLPSVAIPKIIVPLSYMPINQNGKVNTLALPRPPETSSRPIAKPQNELQKTLLKIWAESIGCIEDQIDINDTFDEAGGNSLSLATLETLLNHSKKISLTSYIGINMLSLHMTIASLESSLRTFTQPATNTLPLHVTFKGNTVVMFPNKIKQPSTIKAIHPPAPYRNIT